ncbi:hypothetical protein LSTR_LSTR010948 [Laodelphax striatellus]|uniref:Uncharacterized protein n=1 Tax=Laodelphax striatellus TaxID=195883 RepID=A0A482XVP4_LAOST|nr:hypothetical protein LSTR_LSTR010948 [Laodelphax striatellus]
MARIIAVLVSLMAFCAVARTEDMKKVAVTVYYESLCPDSMKFVVEQLYPTWMTLSQYMDLTLVPFGRANNDFNGSDASVGLRMEMLLKVASHATKLLLSVASTVAFRSIVVLLKVLSLGSTLFFWTGVKQLSCASSIGMTDYTPIEKCVTDESDMLFVAMGNKTMELKPKLESVPAIAFKNEYKPSEQSKYRSDFKMAVCNMIMGDKPAACKGAKGSAGNLVPEFAVSVSLAVISTILSRM